MNTTLPSVTPRKNRRRNRLLVAAAALLALLLGRIVLARLGAALGGKATAAGVRFLSDGSLVLDEPRLRVPDVAGEAGEIFSASRISAHVQLGSLAWGGELVDSIVIDRPQIRVSQSLDDGSLNLAGLSAASGSSSAQAPSTSSGTQSTSHPKIPQITINQGAIEIGEHSAARGFVALKRLDIEGKVESQPDVKGGYQVYLRQVPTPGQPRATNVLDIRGHIASDTLTLEAQGLKLADFPPQALPTRIRAQYSKLNIAGEIGTTTLTYLLRTGGLEVRTGLVGVALNLPVAPKPGFDKNDRVIPVPEALKDRQMRMEQVKGELVLTDKGLSGNVSGLIEEFPYEVTFSVEGTDEQAPFSATLVSRDFELKEHSDLALFAPGVVRRRLEQFSSPTGIVNIEMHITRAAPVNGVAQEVKVGGTLQMRNGSAAFERFPYRFYNMSMEAVFTDTRLELRNITGDTPEGAKVNAMAIVSPLTDDAGVVVEVKVTGLPVNSTLAAAMKHRGKIIDVLFNQEQYRRMLEAGLV
ncbi:MAG: hypothetical protein NTV94_13205, partial [Planctomycetota bacterium]|nr:hypothetical protein [Planctomycetota bacterium]